MRYKRPFSARDSLSLIPSPDLELIDLQLSAVLVLSRERRGLMARVWGIVYPSSHPWFPGLFVKEEIQSDGSETTMAEDLENQEESSQNNQQSHVSNRKKCDPKIKYITL